MLCCFIIYFDYFKFGKKFRIINSKFRSTLFKGLTFGGFNITAIAKCESDKKKSYATKTTNLPLFKGKLATTFEKVDQTFNFERKVWLLFYFVARPKVI